MMKKNSFFFSDKHSFFLLLLGFSVDVMVKSQLHSFWLRIVVDLYGCREHRKGRTDDGKHTAGVHESKFCVVLH